ncbi:hypothetical protein F511_38949 [Dorcoceras hygrometricum]|uniref:Uncharacterized protein n=1 Tax=Dorcoceras hygrometricum TaxID=472368 RepID=A0A2Z7DDD2_9LAMI|nr:hypothetical protein F511_38949 [Dorcoceras hygrometricum]
MEELKPKLGQQQWSRIQDTSFGIWLDMSELAISSRRLDFILNRVDINSCSLIVGDDIMIPLIPNNFSVVLGLHSIGQQVDLDLRMESAFLARQFGGQMGKAKRATIWCAEKVKIVDDTQSKKSETIYHSRCFHTSFRDAMEELKPKLGQQQWSRIQDTSFGIWLDMSELAISSRRLDFILNRVDINSCSLIVGDDIMIPLIPNNFSVVLGLHSIGQQVDLDLRMESAFLARQFGGQMGKAKRATIYTLKFSTMVGEMLHFSFFMRGIRDSGSKTYVDGCTFGLIAWVYERVPSLGVRRSLVMFPRLFPWVNSKIPLNVAKAELSLKSIDSKKDKLRILVHENDKSPVPSELQQYMNRTDYYGHDEATKEEKKLLTTFMREMICKIFMRLEQRESNRKFHTIGEYGFFIASLTCSTREAERGTIYKMQIHHFSHERNVALVSTRVRGFGKEIPNFEFDA